VKFSRSNWKELGINGLAPCDLHLDCSVHRPGLDWPWRWPVAPQLRSGSSWQLRWKPTLVILHGCWRSGCVPPQTAEPNSHSTSFKDPSQYR